MAGLLVLRPVFMPGMPVSSPRQVAEAPLNRDSTPRAHVKVDERGAPGVPRALRLTELELCSTANLWWPPWTHDAGSPARLAQATPGPSRRSSRPGTSRCGACAPPSSTGRALTTSRRRPSPGPSAPGRQFRGRGPRRGPGCSPSRATSASTSSGRVHVGGATTPPSAPPRRERPPTRAGRWPSPTLSGPSTGTDRGSVRAHPGARPVLRRSGPGL